MNTILWSRCSTSPKMNKGFIYDTPYSILNMKRKALTLQHHNNSFKITNAQLYSKIVRNTYPNNHQPNILPYNTNINIDISICNPEPNSIVTSSSASQSDVPGDKSFIINYDYKTPIYNYIPVKRKQSNASSKYPYTAWTSGRLGFGVGKKGSDANMRKLANDNLKQNKTQFSPTTINTCNNRNCEYQTIYFKIDQTTILGQIEFIFSDIDSQYRFSIWDLANKSPDTSNIATLEFKFIEIEKNDVLYNQGMIWYIPYTYSSTQKPLKVDGDGKARFFLVLTWTEKDNNWHLYLTNSFKKETKYIIPTNYMYPLLNSCPPPLLHLQFNNLSLSNNSLFYYSTNYNTSPNPVQLSDILSYISVFEPPNTSQQFIINNKKLPLIISQKIFNLHYFDTTIPYWWNTKYKYISNSLNSTYSIVLNSKFIESQDNWRDILNISPFNNIICN